MKQVYRYLIEPCIKAGCPIDGVVLDPFGGSGTTGQVALTNHRKSVLVELNPQYAKLITKRIEKMANDLPMFQSPMAQESA